MREGRLPKYPPSIFSFLSAARVSPPLLPRGVSEPRKRHFSHARPQQILEVQNKAQRRAPNSRTPVPPCTALRAARSPVIYLPCSSGTATVTASGTELLPQITAWPSRPCPCRSEGEGPGGAGRPPAHLLAPLPRGAAAGRAQRGPRQGLGPAACHLACSEARGLRLAKPPAERHFAVNHELSPPGFWPVRRHHS